MNMQAREVIKFWFEVIGKVRSIRNDYSIPSSTELSLYIEDTPEVRALAMDSTRALAEAAGKFKLIITPNL